MPGRDPIKAELQAGPQRGTMKFGTTKRAELRFYRNMDQCVIVVDNSNIFIEGQKASAKAKGVAPDPATPTRRPNDPSWRIDFGGLLAELAAGRKIYAAVLVGSRRLMPGGFCGGPQNRTNPQVSPFHHGGIFGGTSPKAVVLARRNA
jgi:hypothetical protein